MPITRSGWTTELGIALARGDTKRAQTAVDKGARVESAELHEQIRMSRKESVEFLLDHGAEITVDDILTAFRGLSYAGSGDKVGVFRLLIERRPDVAQEALTHLNANLDQTISRFQASIKNAKEDIKRFKEFLPAELSSMARD